MMYVCMFFYCIFAYFNVLGAANHQLNVVCTESPGGQRLIGRAFICVTIGDILVPGSFERIEEIMKVICDSLHD
jgi:hypothetical protein